jgi:hypothetical protein
LANVEGMLCASFGQMRQKAATEGGIHFLLIVKGYRTGLDGAGDGLYMNDM